MFDKLGNLAGMLKQAQQMKGKMAEINVQLKQERVTGSAGAGMVEVDADGTGEVLAVRISPEVFEGGDRSFVEDLIPQAINDAAAKAREVHQEKMKNVTGGMAMPGLDKMMSQMFGS